MFDIRKWIPGHIEIRSVYHQEIYLNISEDLATIADIIDQFFNMEDTRKSIKLRLQIVWLITLFEKKYIHTSVKYPGFIKERISEVYFFKHIIDM